MRRPRPEFYQSTGLVFTAESVTFDSESIAKIHPRCPRPTAVSTAAYLEEGIDDLIPTTFPSQEELDEDPQEEEENAASRTAA